MKYVLGVDQGGSGTRAVVCSLDGMLLGTGIGPGACHAFTGMPFAMRATQDGVQKALQQAGLPPGRAQVYVGGHTGADWDYEYPLLQEAVRGLDLAGEVYIVNDSIAALRGGTDQPYGAILVAGTGANCAVLAPDGRQFIYHYYHDQDLQGGSAIGRAALQAIYRAETGRPPQTSLRERVLRLYRLPDVDHLMRAMIEEKIASRSIPEIAPLVFEEASKDDQAACRIVVDFGRGCAGLLTNALGRMEMAAMPVEIVLSGGIFKARSALLHQTLEDAVLTVVPKARFIKARYEPVVGAAMLALEKTGISLDAEIQSNIERSAKALCLVRV